MSAMRPEPLHPDAVAISAFRVLPNGTARQYTITQFPEDPHGAIERRIRRAVGHVRSTAEVEQPYAVLDVRNADDDIVQDYAVPDARAWRYVKGKFHFRVDTSA